MELADTAVSMGLKLVYEDCKVYGPYKNKKDGRLRVFIVSKIKRTTVSYPKYLMEIHLDRYLDDNEVVHHIDEDPTNNDLDNLEIKSTSKHARDHMLNREKTFWELKVAKYGLEEASKMNAHFGNKNASGNKGKPKSKKHKENLSISNKGVPWSEARRQSWLNSQVSNESSSGNSGGGTLFD